MKSRFRNTFLSIFVASAFFAAPAAQAEGNHEGGKFDPEKKLAKMKEELNLSDDQVAKLKAHFEARRAEREAAMKKSHEELAQILNPEQMKKFEEKLKQRGEGFKKEKKSKD